MTLFFSIITFLMLAGSQVAFGADKISLAGTWQFKLDPTDAGIAGQWFGQVFQDSLLLPGSLPEQGIGNDITVNTPWTGDLTGSWFLDPQYAPYRTPGNIKVSFFLQPDKYYVGAAWYQRRIEIPQSWSGLNSLLSLERVHWGTMVWVDGVPFGNSDSLGTPHLYDLGGLTPGSHLLSIRVDNRLIIDVGSNASSVTDHTQGNWNGIVGEISLSPVHLVRFDDVQVYPHLSNKTITIKGAVTNPGHLSGTGSLSITIASRTQPERPAISVTNPISWNATNSDFSMEVQLGTDAPVWDEFTPALFDLTVSLGGTQAGDSRQLSFGLREITSEGTQFAINGRKTFLRGTLECCVFPNSGHPPTDVASWRRIIGIAKSFGLNLMRFHSWCPPEAAFQSADELGFYFQVECETWSHPGEGSSVDNWLYTEAERILKSYGNHPSFLLMVSGNEPAGSKYDSFLTQWVAHFKALDSRHLFAGASGWPELDVNQFHVSFQPRIQIWGEGLTSPINGQSPRTTADYGWFIGNYSVPVISHEIGQWCAYPNFDEIPKYTNYLKPKNLEIFRDFLELHQMKDLARPFLMASGKLQVLCYKEEIEAALRTPGMGGFELLDLHDFPGQGTALVGVLDAFWDEKGYVTAAEYSRFCNSTVPLVRLQKRVFTTSETLDAQAEVAHFGTGPLTNVIPAWSLVGDDGVQAMAGTLRAQTIPIGNGISLGSLHINLSQVPAPARYKLVLGLSGTQFTNDWDVWVYPAQLPAEPADPPIITQSLTPAILDQLTHGAKVLLTVPASGPSTLSGRVQLGFSSIFWNTAWAHGQQPTTLGILCDPSNPLFKYFPTDSHSNWQWWYLLTGADAIVLDDLPAELSPAVRVIDDWYTARRLGMLFEAKFGTGRLIVCSINVETGLDTNIVARQFRQSLLNYMASEDFNPATELNSAQLAQFSPVLDAASPVIIKNPVDAVRSADHPLVLEAVVGGTPPFTYSWFQNGREFVSGLSFTTNISMTIFHTRSTDAGTYSLQVTNVYGSTVSQTATVDIIDSPQGSYLNAVVDQGPIAYWTFDAGTNNLNQSPDLAGNHVLNHSNTTLEPGPVPPGFFGFASSNNASSYNGVNGGSQAPSLSIAKLGSFTLMGWFKPAVMPQPARTGLFGQNDFAEFGFHDISGQPGGVLGFWVAGPIGRDVGFGTLVLCTNTESLITAGNWYFVAATADGTNSALYLNGALISTASAGVQDHYGSTFPFQVGFGTLDGSGDYFNGAIDEVAVFDRALSAAEIYLLYSRGAQGVGPQLKVHTTNGNAVLEWTFGLLQASGDLSGTFTNVDRAVTPYSVPIKQPESFFQIKVK